MKRQCPETESKRKRIKPSPREGNERLALDDLPPEMIGSILEYLPMGQMLDCGRLVCKRFCSVMNTIAVQVNEEIKASILYKASESELKLKFNTILLSPQDRGHIDRLLASDVFSSATRMIIPTGVNGVCEEIRKRRKFPANVKCLTLRSSRNGMWCRAELISLLSSELMRNVERIDLPSFVDQSIIGAIETNRFATKLKQVRIQHVSDEYSGREVGISNLPIIVDQVEFDFLTNTTLFASGMHKKYDQCTSVTLNCRFPPEFFTKEFGKARFSNVSSIKIGSDDIDKEAIETMMDEKVLPRLTDLEICARSSREARHVLIDTLTRDNKSLKLSRLAADHLDSHAIVNIASSPNLKNLRELCMYRDEAVGESPLCLLGNSREITRLESITIAPLGRTSLFPCHNFGFLKCLIILDCENGDDLIRNLSNSSDKIEKISLTSSNVTDISPITSSKNFSNLTDLSLNRNLLDDRAIVNISQSNSIKKLERIALSSNRIKDISSMAHSENFLFLKDLNLSINPISASVTAIANIKAPRLDFVDIRHTNMSGASLLQIRESNLAKKLDIEGHLLI